MRILSLDIETSPNLAYVWGLWNQNVGLNQLVSTTEMLCFAAKWMGEDEVMFFSSHRDGQAAMVAAARELLDEADVVMHFNGRKFDIPHLNRELILAGLTPPSPYSQIDLLQVVRKKFRFASNKLAHVSVALGLEGKVSHEGFDLWVKCMAGDDAAWARMEEYNRQDVVLLEELYHILLPWISNHPNRRLYGGNGGCPSCGSEDAPASKGFAYTKLSKFRQFRCSDCGSWFRSSRREEGVDLQQAAS